MPDTTLKIALDMLTDLQDQVWLPVKGESMSPLLRNGDQVLVDFNPGSARLGEIVLFQRNDELVTHRLLMITNSSDGETVILTKGDNRANCDPVNNKTNMIGKVIAIRRNERRLWMNTRAWNYANRLIAKIMLIEAQLYQLFRRWSENLNSPVLRFLAQRFQSVIRAFLRLMYSLASRWQE